MPAKSKAAPSTQSSATIGFEAKLWLTADKRRLGELIDLLGTIALTGRDRSPSDPSEDSGRIGEPSLPSSDRRPARLSGAIANPVGSDPGHSRGAVGQRVACRQAGD